MQKLRVFRNAMLRLLRKIRRYPRELRGSDTENRECDLDNIIICMPLHTLNCFRFEYILSCFFNFIIPVVSLLYFFHGKENDIHARFSLLVYWLRFGIILHFLSVLPKIIVLMRLFKIPYDDERLIVRRLMLLVRSNIFFLNEKVSFVMYTYYIFGMGKLASSNGCQGMKSELYRLCHFIIFSFLLRLINLFVRYLVESYYSVRSVERYILKNRGASNEEIKAIPEVEITKKMMEESGLCGICLQKFIPGEKVKKLPCSEKHFFHKDCTEIWLLKQNMCPYCRKRLDLLVV